MILLSWEYDQWKFSWRGEKERTIVRKSPDGNAAYSHRANGRDGALIFFENHITRDDHAEVIRLHERFWHFPGFSDLLDVILPGNNVHACTTARFQQLHSFLNHMWLMHCSYNLVATAPRPTARSARKLKAFSFGASKFQMASASTNSLVRNPIEIRNWPDH